MRLLNVPALAAVVFGSELVGKPWWRLTALPPLNLLPTHPVLFPFGARLLVLAALAALCRLIIAWGAVHPAPVLARHAEPTWATVERLSRLIERPGDQPVLLWGTVVLCAGMLLAVLLPGIRVSAATTVMLSILLGYAAYRALRPVEAAVPAPVPDPALDADEMPVPAQWGAGWHSVGPGGVPDEPADSEEEIDWQI